MLRLKAQIAEQEAVLREDAMYFLLVSMDHMVIQAFFGYLPEASSPLGQQMAPYASSEDVDKMVSQSLKEIFEELAAHRVSGAKSSANAVIRAINARHDKLSEIILWWRE
jgi:hypothetical protein